MSDEQGDAKGLRAAGEAFVQAAHAAVGFDCEDELADVMVAVMSFVGFVEKHQDRFGVPGWRAALDPPAAS